jgi:hypothetical protein
MTAPSLTYLAVREHIDDLRRDADRHRRVAQARPARRITLSIPRLLARRIPRPASARASDPARLTELARRPTGVRGGVRG